MGVYRFTYANADMEEIGTFKNAEVNMAYGIDENSEDAFKIYFPRHDFPKGLAKGYFVYIEGTEWGGRVTRLGSLGTQDKVAFKGDTWHGYLKHKIVRAPKGSSNLVVSGSYSECVAQIMGNVDVGMPYVVRPMENEGRIASYSVPVGENAYMACMNMLFSVGCRLSINMEAPSLVFMPAPVIDYSENEEIDAALSAIDVEEDYLPVNHYVCAGPGQGANRIFVDLYADRDRNVSQTQTLFGLDERAEFYDYPSADTREKLIEEGTKRLKELQNTQSGDLSVTDNRDYQVGDIVGRCDSFLGIDQRRRTSKIIFRQNDRAKTTYEFNVAVS